MRALSLFALPIDDAIVLRSLISAFVISSVRFSYPEPDVEILGDLLEIMMGFSLLLMVVELISMGPKFNSIMLIATENLSAFSFLS